MADMAFPSHRGGAAMADYRALVGDVIHPELFELSGQRVAAPAQKFRCRLAMALCVA